MIYNELCYITMQIKGFTAPQVATDVVLGQCQHQGTLHAVAQLRVHLAPCFGFSGFLKDVHSGVKMNPQNWSYFYGLIVIFWI